MVRTLLLRVGVLTHLFFKVVKSMHAIRFHLLNHAAEYLRKHPTVVASAVVVEFAESVIFAYCVKIVL